MNTSLQRLWSLFHVFHASLSLVTVEKDVKLPITQSQCRMALVLCFPWLHPLSGFPLLKPHFAVPLLQRCNVSEQAALPSSIASLEDFNSFP